MYYSLITALVQFILTDRGLPNTPDNRLVVLEEIRNVWSEDSAEGTWTDNELAFLACANVMIETINIDKQFNL